MKRSNKRGFTLVELVIVIAVIAILAGVMIATFAGVVNDAKESAKLQEAQQAELNQKIEDVTAKLENAEWLGWEDFENELAAQLAAHDQVTSDAINDALKAYAESNANANTGLTEDQVKTIVERALEGQLTEAQVQAAVNSAYSTLEKKINGIQPLTVAQVSSIVNAATANQLTASDINRVVAMIADTNDAIDSVEAAIAEVKKNALTEDQITAILNTYLPRTQKVNNAVDFAKAAADLMTGSTIVVTEAITEPVTIAFNDEKVLTIEGEAIDSLTINAPNGTVALHANVNKLTVEAIANASLHIFGKVETIALTEGHVVVEPKATVATVTVAPEAKASVTVEPAASVETVTIDAKAEGAIEVENNGHIVAVKIKNVVVETVGETTTTNTTNILVQNNGTMTEEVVVTGEGDAEIEKEVAETVVSNTVSVSERTTHEVATEDELVALLKGNDLGLGDTIKLIRNITLTQVVAIDEYTNIVLDLNGFDITQTAIRANDNQIDYALDNNGIMTIKGEGTISGRGVQNYGIMTIENGTFECVGTNGGAAIWNESKLYINDGNFVVNHVGSASDEYGPGCVNNSGTAIITGGVYTSASERTYAIISTGDMTIANATVNGTHGALSVDGGQTVVNGGIYVSKNYYGLYTSNDGGEATVLVNGGTFEGKVCSVLIGSDVNTSVNSSIVITNGTFFNGIKKQSNVTNVDGLVVKGGAFKYDEAAINVKQYLAEGYELTEGTEGVVVKIAK